MVIKLNLIISAKRIAQHQIRFFRGSHEFLNLTVAPKQVSGGIIPVKRLVVPINEMFQFRFQLLRISVSAMFL